MSIIGYFHNLCIYTRRVEVLANQICELLPENAKVLDVGCGDGKLDQLIMKRRPDINIQGVDVLIRPVTFIPVDTFDGAHLPYEDNSYDVVMFVDVLHHTMEKELLLNEAKRISLNGVMLKDHTRNGLFANATLKFMDWVGNRHHGVVLPYEYWSYDEWMDAIGKLSLSVKLWRSTFKLYPWPASWLFDRSLHFITLLEKA